MRGDPFVDTSPLTGWDNFFVIAGSSAAGLTGLTFIVITLAAEARRVNANALRIFITPTIVHFSAVLGAAAFLSMPRQTLLSVSWGCGVAGAAGILYVMVIGAGIRRIATAYAPVREDWIWNVILPAAAYGCLFAVAFLIRPRPVESIYGVAAAMVLLMFVGIHNAWDIAVWNSVRKQDEPSTNT
jgi:hypothetical protein